MPHEHPRTGTHRAAPKEKKDEYDLIVIFDSTEAPARLSFRFMGLKILIKREEEDENEIAAKV